MIRKAIQLSLLILLILFSTWLLVVCWPRHYEVPVFQERPGTQYWDLSNGSHIGYTLIPAKGAKKSSPVIYLHGGPGGPIYDRNIKLLAPLADDGYDVYLYDQIGGGHSARLDDIEAYTPERHVQDLELIIDKIGAEKVILIGQSWGGILASLYAAGHPDKLEKIIFTCPGPIQPQQRELAEVQPPDSLHLREPKFLNARGNREARNIRSNMMSYLAVAFGYKLAPDAEADNFNSFLGGKLNRSLVCDASKTPPAEPGSGYYVSIMTVSKLNEIKDPRPALRRVKCPVLVMKGQCDSIKWGYTQEYLELFTQHKLLVIPDAGHSIALEQPALYFSSIHDFLLDGQTGEN